jgi:hypothetical protein
VSLIPFPNVPNLPGVPSLYRAAGLAVIPAPLFASLDSLNLPFLQEVTRWGIYSSDGATQLLIPDSVVGLEYGNESRVSDYPQESGSFASYNKVGTPFTIRVRMTIGGSEADRSAFLATCDALLASTDLVSVLTPERVYLSATLVGYDYRRDSRNGVTLLTVDTTFREVRVTAASQYSSSTSQSVGGAPTETRGQVQPTDATNYDLSTFIPDGSIVAVQ